VRIIGGTLGGRRIPGAASTATRATTDRVREAVASILEARGALERAVVLDLFAGTGALSFEALSRGAARAVCAERDRRAVVALKRTAAELGLSDRITTLPLDLARPEPAVRRLSSHGPFSLVFADPPYAEVERAPALFAALRTASLLAAGALVVLEHGRGQPPRSTGGLAQLASYRYGDSAIDLLAVGETDEAGDGSTDKNEDR
jgi:16S rRNA (guanine966-N2)-methyltransferase